MNAYISRTLAHLSLGAMAALCLLTAAGPNAQAQSSENNKGQLSSHDYKFVSAAARGGEEEVTLGELAAQKGTDPSVREFGQRMAQDHQKVNQQLTQLASQKGATLPSTPTGREEGRVDKLKNMSGADFDKAYMKEMVSDHKKDVKEFQSASTKADDADVKAFAAKTMPTLEEHLQMAESIQTKLSGEQHSSAQ